MTTPATNISGAGIQNQETKPSDSQTQGSTQTAIPAPPPFAIKKAKVPADPVVQPIQKVDIPDIVPIATVDEAPVTIDPIQPIDIPDIAPITTVDAAPLTGEDKVAAGKAKAAALGIDLPTERGVDFSETERLLQEQKEARTQKLREDVAKVERSTFSQLSHDALAQSRDSGYVNAAKVASIRRSNNILYDGLTALDSQFTENMITLSREKSLQDADFNEERYREFQTANADIIGSLFDAGMIDEAIAHAQAVAAVDDSPFWQKFNNADYVNNLIITQNKELQTVYNADIKGAVRRTAINANTADGINMAESITSMINNWDQMPEFAQDDALTFFSNVNNADLETFGIDTDEDKELMNMFKKGQIGWDDQEFKKMYAEAVIKYNQTEFNKDNIKAALGVDTFNKYKSDPTATALLESFINSDAGADGVIGYNGENLSTYGQALSGRTVINAPGVDNKFQDWDFIPYVDGENTNNFTDSLEDEYVLNAGESGEKTYTGQELNSLYDEYHREMSRLFDSGEIEAGEVMNMRKFKESLENTLSDPDKRAAIDSAENEEDAIVDLLKGEDLTVEGKTITEGEFVDPVTGDITNMSKFNIDISEFTDSNDVRDIKSILSGEKSIHDLGVSDLESMMADDRNIIKKLAESGALERTTISTDNFIKGDNGLLGLADNPNNQFTGKSAVELWRTLDNGQGYVLIDDTVYNVTGTVGRHNTRKGWLPVINWTVTPVGTDGNQEKYRGILPNDQGQETHFDKGDALQIGRLLLGNPQNESIPSFSGPSVPPGFGGVSNEKKKSNFESFSGQFEGNQ